MCTAPSHPTPQTCKEIAHRYQTNASTCCFGVQPLFFVCPQVSTAQICGDNRFHHLQLHHRYGMPWGSMGYCMDLRTFANAAVILRCSSLGALTSQSLNSGLICRAKATDFSLQLRLLKTSSQKRKGDASSQDMFCSFSSRHV